jgi:hypothetical protein
MRFIRFLASVILLVAAVSCAQSPASIMATKYAGPAGNGNQSGLGNVPHLSPQAIGFKSRRLIGVDAVEQLAEAGVAPGLQTPRPDAPEANRPSIDTSCKPDASANLACSAAVVGTTINGTGQGINAKAYGAKGDGVANDTTSLQNALNAAFAAQEDLFIPSGVYLVTGLRIPGRALASQDDRGKTIRLHGVGTGEPFAVSGAQGTILRSITDVPILQDYSDGDSKSDGTVEIDHIRFDATSNTAPVILLNAFFGTSSFHHNVVYQRGSGDGFSLGWAGTVNVHDNYFLNRDFAVAGLGALRTGIGVKYNPTHDVGLVTFSKNTSRGWKTAYSIADGSSATAYSPTLRDSEVSTVYNGVKIGNTVNALLDADYFEGGEGGVGITDPARNICNIYRYFPSN